MKTLVVSLLMLFVLGCSKPNNPKNENIFRKKSTKNIVKTCLEEIFIDSTNIGDKGKFKIQLMRFLEMNNRNVVIALDKKENGKWVSKQKLTFENYGPGTCDAKIQDFNNDRLKDFTFQYDIGAARGGNISRKLLLFDKKNGMLKVIKNSADYPNLQYNNLLKCVDSYIIYSGTSTVFLKIENDSLKEFVCVSLAHNGANLYREVSLVDKNGKYKTIKHEIVDDYKGTGRFKNYCPVIDNPVVN